jgi:hypothetical protein
MRWSIMKLFRFTQKALPKGVSEKIHPRQDQTQNERLISPPNYGIELARKVGYPPAQNSGHAVGSVPHLQKRDGARLPSLTVR